MSLLIPRIDFSIKNFTGTTTISSDVITAVPDTSEIVVGQVIKGTGIPFQSIVLSKTSNSVTISEDATAANTAIALTAATMVEFVYPPSDDSEWQMKAVGTKVKSISGLSQVVTQYIEETRKLTFGFITHTVMNNLRSTFFTESLNGNKFHYFEDKAVNSYETCEFDVLSHSRKRQVKKHPNFLYEFDMTIRKAV